MRHNQNGRRYRGRSNGGGQGHHHNHNNGQRRINPRVHTFDSNGPDVRIRGNAFQITEKYQALAKDAAAAGDRVLAESYLQHAEHYQRLINEASDEASRNQQHYPQQGHHTSNGGGRDEESQPLDAADAEQPVIDAAGLADLDQGFLVGRRTAAPVEAEDEAQPPVAATRQRAPRAAKTAE